MRFVTYLTSVQWKAELVIFVIYNTIENSGGCISVLGVIRHGHCDSSSVLNGCHIELIPTSTTAVVMDSVVLNAWITRTPKQGSSIIT